MASGTGRRVFLGGMGFVYLAAFVSYYVQYQGLYGREGLDPLRATLGRYQAGAPLVEKMATTPLLAWFASELDVDIDDWMEGVALSGVAAAAAAVAGCDNIAIFTWLFVAYRDLFVLGGTFLGFQWDILLLEAGFLCIFYRRAGPAPIRWAVRLLAFKLFFMTGCVKINSNCPTWAQLTALRYHYASQCLPTPAAYYFHSLPQWFHALSLTFVLASQLVGAFFLVAPALGFRRFAAGLQVLNMMLIGVTGNYNWFNIHAALLCLPAWEREWGRSRAQGVAGGGEEDKEGGEEGCEVDDGAPPAFAMTLLAGALAACVARTPQDAAAIALAWVAHLPGLSDAYPRVQFACAVGAFVMFWGLLFVDWSSSSSSPASAWKVYTANLGDPVSALLDDPIRFLSSIPLRSNVSPAVLREFVPRVLPLALRYVIACVALAGAGEITTAWTRATGQNVPTTSPIRRVARTLHQAALTLAALVIVVNAVAPMKEVYPGGRWEAEALPSWPGVARARGAWEEHLGGSTRVHAFSGYGLFRRMTGVDERTGAVAVPVVVLEVQARSSSSEGGRAQWREVQFRYAPGGVEEAPRWNIPHQPRLDWQLWFAALAPPQQYPQLLHLVTKILRRERYACYLVGGLPCDDPAWRPLKVRAKRYHYDFTDAWGGGSSSSSSSAWWTRKEVESFYPELSLDDARRQLGPYFAARGWSVDAALPTPADAVLPANPIVRALQHAVRWCRAAVEDVRRRDATVSLIMMITSTVLALRGSRAVAAWVG